MTKNTPVNLKYSTRNGRLRGWIHYICIIIAKKMYANLIKIKKRHLQEYGERISWKELIF
jgi:hypothetical protein